MPEPPRSSSSRAVLAAARAALWRQARTRTVLKQAVQRVLRDAVQRVQARAQNVLKQAVHGAQARAKTAVLSALNSAQAKAQGALNSAQAKAQGALSNAQTSAKDALSNAQTSAQVALNSAQTSAQAALSNAQTSAKDALNSAQTSAQDAFRKGTAPYGRWTRRVSAQWARRAALLPPLLPPPPPAVQAQHEKAQQRKRQPLQAALSMLIAQHPVARQVRAESASTAVHPELQMRARVRPYDLAAGGAAGGAAMCAEEAAFVRRRRDKVALAFAKLMRVPAADVHPDDVPVVAIAASGGGYRAMIAAVGSLVGADDEGVLACTTYFAGLSGSTWLLAQWLAAPASADVRDLRGAVAARVQRDLFDFDARTTDAFVAELAHHLDQRRAFTVVDAFGVLLASRLLNDAVDAGAAHRRIKLSELARPAMQLASVPLPIFTAVSDPTSDGVAAAVSAPSRLWLETTPFEAGSAGLGAFVPTWALGRTFDAGETVSTAPELSLGFIMGSAGSAFCATRGQVWDELMGKVRPRALQVALASFVHSELQYMRKYAVRPATVPNPTLGLDPAKFPLAARTDIGVMDAGLHFNLPLPPLLRPDRGVDVVIVLDNSAHVQTTDHLGQALKYARRRYPHRQWPQLDHAALARRICSVVSSPDISIVYLPLIANLKHTPFNPRQHMGAFGHLNTGNFKYTHERTMQLSELTRFNFGASASDIRAELWRVYLAKKQRRTRSLSSPQ